MTFGGSTMTKRLALGLLCIVALATFAAAAVGLLAPPVYTVDVVQTGLRAHPTAWVGRTVRVRGWVTAYEYGRGCGAVPAAPAPPVLAGRGPVTVSVPIMVHTPSPCRATWLVLSSANPVVPSSGSGSRIVAVATPALPVLLPQNVRIPPLADDGLAAILSQLPIVGPVLFHEVNSAALRVRLTTRSSACAGLSPCLSGTLVP